MEMEEYVKLSSKKKLQRLHILCREQSFLSSQGEEENIFFTLQAFQTFQVQGIRTSYLRSI